MPSSIDLILFPDKCRTRKLDSECNSDVEKMGFSESPNKLSVKCSSINSSWMPAKTFSPSLRMALNEKSNFFSGRFELANACKMIERTFCNLHMVDEANF